MKYQRRLFSWWIPVLVINWCALAIPPPDFATRDLPLILEQLNIQDAERQGIISDLLSDYENSYRTAVDRLRSDIAALYADQDASKLMRLNLERTEQFLRSRVEMTEILEVNIELILAPQERNEWTEFMRWNRRLHLLPRGELIGEKLDIARVYEDVASSIPTLSSADVTSLIDGWTKEVDAALLEREPMSISGNTTFRRLFGDERYDEAYRILAATLQARVRLRDLSLTTAQSIAELLPQEEGLRWLAAVRRDTGQRPMLDGILQRAKVLATSSDCADLVLPLQAEMVRRYENECLTLDSEVFEARVLMDEARAMRPVVRWAGGAPQLEARQEALLELMIQSQKLRDEINRDMCRQLTTECCTLLMNRSNQRTEDTDMPADMRGPGRGKPEPPSPFGPTPFDKDLPFPEDEPGTKPDSPMPFPESDPMPETPPPGMEPQIGPDPPDPFGPPDPQAKRAIERHPGMC